MRHAVAPTHHNAVYNCRVDILLCQQEVSGLRDGIAMLGAEVANASDGVVLRDHPVGKRALDGIHHRLRAVLAQNLREQSRVVELGQEGRRHEVFGARVEQRARVGHDTVHERGRQQNVFAPARFQRQQAVLNIVGVDGRRRPDLAQVQELRRHAFLTLVVVHDDNRGHAGLFQPGAHAGRRPLAIHKHRPVIRLEVHAINVIGNQVQVEQPDQSNILLVTDPPAIGQVHVNLKPGGDELVSIGGRDGVGVREILEYHQVTLAAMAFQRLGQLIRPFVQADHRRGRLVTRPTRIFEGQNPGCPPRLAVFLLHSLTLLRLALGCHSRPPLVQPPNRMA